MRRWRYPFSLISLSIFILVLILSRISSIQAAESLTVGVVNPDSLYINPGGTFNVEFTASGGLPAAVYTYSLESGLSSLPPNTFFENDPTHVIPGFVTKITGTPPTTAEGKYTVNLKVVDDAGNTSPLPSTPFDLCVGVQIAPTTPTLPAITATVAYTAVTITSTCGKGPVVITSTGLPTGINLVDNGNGTATISGTTALEGSFTVNVTAKDVLNREKTRTYTIQSTYPPLTYTPAKLDDAARSVSYNKSITFGGQRPTPLTVTVVNGAGKTLLPTGLTTSVSAGKLTVSGTPTLATDVGKTFQVVVSVADSASTPKSEEITFPFDVVEPSLTISPGTGLAGTAYTLPGATVGNSFSQTLTASGGSGTYTFSLDPTTSLPPGISLTAAGLIDGNPTAAGLYGFTINVFDTSTPQRTGKQTYSLTIGSPSSPTYSSNFAVGTIIDFGLVTTPGATVTRKLTITNTSTNSAAILKVTAPSSGPILTGLNAGDFGFVVAPANRVPPVDIPGAGQSVTFEIKCTPSSTLFASVATMTFQTNDPGKPTVSYQLRCNQVIPTSTPGVGTPTAVSGTAGPSVVVLARATGFATDAPRTFATVTFVKGLALRSGPYLGATMLGVIRPKKDYAVVAMNGGDGEGKFNWYLVVDVDNNRIGWASGRYLILKGDPNIPFANTIFDQIDNARDVKARLTIFGNVNIRARPSDRMPVIHTTAYGTELEVIGRTVQAGVTQWVQVRFYDATTGRPIVGWVYYNFNAPELMKLTGIAPLDAVPLR